MFAYCLNNPVMYIDSSGTFVLVGTLTAAVVAEILFKICISILLVYAAWQTGTTIGQLIQQYAPARTKNTVPNKISTKSTSTPANPPPPNDNNNNKDKKNNVSYSTRFSAKSTHAKNGVRVDYEYNGNGSGNVHVTYKGKKIKVFEINQSGITTNNFAGVARAEWFTNDVAKIISNYINIVYSLGGWG